MLFLFSCKQTAVQQKLSVTDSVMVQFFNEDGLIYKAITSTEEPAIKKLSSFMDNRSVTPAKCGSSGKVLFYSDRRLLLDVTYHLISEECRYFTYTMDGRLLHVAMSNEAADFLTSLREGP